MQALLMRSKHPLQGQHNLACILVGFIAWAKYTFYGRIT